MVLGFKSFCTAVEERCLFQHCYADEEKLSWSPSRSSCKALLSIGALVLVYVIWVVGYTKVCGMVLVFGYHVLWNLNWKGWGFEEEV